MELNKTLALKIHVARPSVWHDISLFFFQLKNVKKHSIFFSVLHDEHEPHSK